MKSNEMAKLAALALEEKKAYDIRILDIKAISSIGDYLVIADGSNRNQIQAMCDAVEEKMQLAGAPLKNREGYSNAGWILLDYYDIIVHIFSNEERSFYDLEHIWRDGNIVSAGEL